MSVTVAEKSKAYRQRKAAKLQRLARLEAALEEIADANGLDDALSLAHIAQDALYAGDERGEG